MSCVLNPGIKETKMSNTTFSKAFARLENSIPFNPAWKNRTGYLDNAVHDKSITITSTTIDDFGRKVIIVPTTVGNVVVFERFSGGDRGIIVSNAPRQVASLGAGLDLHGSLGDNELEFYLGTEWGTSHIGQRIDDLLKLVNLLAKAK